MFDPESFTVGGIQLIATVFGLVEFLKDMLGWEGKRVTLLAASLGAVVMVAHELIGIVPDPYQQVLTIVFQSLAFGLSAAGYFKFINKRNPEVTYLDDLNDAE